MRQKYKIASRTQSEHIGFFHKHSTRTSEFDSTDNGKPMTVTTLKAKTEVLINISTLRKRHFATLIYLYSFN